MFWQMIAVEQKKLNGRKILWIELAIMAAAAVLLPLLIYIASQSDGSGSLVITTDGPVDDMLVWPLALNVGRDLGSGGFLGGLLIVILVGTLTAQEYGWRTMQLWLGQGVSRPVLLLAKFTAVLLPALLLVVVPFAVGGLTTAVFTQNLQGSLPFAEVNGWQAALSLIRTAYTLLPYAALAFFLAIVSRSTVVAIGGGLAYTVLIEGVITQLFTFVGGTWATIAQHLPAGLSSSLSTLNRVTDAAPAPLPAEMVDPGTAVLGIALYTLFFVGLALLAFRRQDLGG